MHPESVTRGEELMRVLALLARDIPHARWIALVEQNGLVIGFVPADPNVNPEGVAGITAAAVMVAERVLNEVMGGQLRYMNIAGSACQYLMVMIKQDRFLAVGLPSDALVQATFRPILKRIPQLLEIIERRFSQP
jgi:predicted regulator of Ras-like GTPase activity (Roadblock/LC7/MglB family)